MKKTIILNDRGLVEMTYEEVLIQFEDMINKFASSTLDKIVYNKPEREDLLQELKLQVWEAFQRYSVETGNAFSTYLFYRLQHGIHRGTMKLYAKKRTNTAGIISLNQAMGGEDGELEFEGLLGEDDLELTSLGFREFMSHLEKILDPCEKKILKVLMDKNDFSVQDLALELGMSRQGANKKVNKFREKMAIIMRETGFVAC